MLSKRLKLLRGNVSNLRKDKQHEEDEEIIQFPKRIQSMDSTICEPAGSIVFRDTSLSL